MSENIHVILLEIRNSAQITGNRGRRRARVLTAPSDVDVQVASDDRAALQGLSSIHWVDCFRFADLIAQSVACTTKHTAGGREREKKGRVSVKDRFQPHKQANASEPWQDYCVSPKHEVYLRLVFDKLKVTALWGFMHLTESSLEPWVLCERKSLNQQWGKTRSGQFKGKTYSTSKKLHGKVNEVIFLLIFYLKSAGVLVKSKLW